MRNFKLVAICLLLSLQSAAAASRVHCARMQGGDAASTLNACIARTESGGIADARRLTGELNITAPVTISKPLALVLGCSTWTMRAPIVVATSDVQIVGNCGKRSVLRRATGYRGRLVSVASSGFMGLEVSGLTFDNGAYALDNGDSSAQIFLGNGTGGVDIHHNLFVNQGAGRAIASASWVVAPRYVRITHNRFSGPMAAALVASAVRSADIMTVTTAGPHGFGAGQLVAVYGSSHGDLAIIAPILSVLGPKQFQVGFAGPDAAARRGGEDRQHAHDQPGDTGRSCTDK